MGFTEVASLDADVTIALGKKDKATGKPYPKTAEGYFLGSRNVENKRGESKLHFLQTPEGNLGIWGTTDLNRKLSQVIPGTMVHITSTGTKPTPNGDMYTYKVMVDKSNTIEVNLESDTGYTAGGDQEESDQDTDVEEVDQSSYATSALQRKENVENLLRRGKKN